MGCKRDQMIGPFFDFLRSIPSVRSLALNGSLKILINLNINQDKINNTLLRKYFYQKNKNQLQGIHPMLLFYEVEQVKQIYFSQK